MAEFKLVSEVIRVSNSHNWDTAKFEWKLNKITISNKPQTCLCGHNPIINLCTLINTINNNTIVVGNCCVKKFFGLDPDKIKNSYLSVKDDNLKSFTSEIINKCYENHTINDWEYNFYLNIIRKRKLSVNQGIKKKDINLKILSRVKWNNEANKTKI